MQALIIKPMIRTQVYLPDNVYYSIQELAQRECVSMAAKIREFVTQGLGLRREKPQSFLGALRDISFDGNESTPKDLETNHDKYLYES